MSDADAGNGAAEIACEGASLAYTDGTRTTYALREISVRLTPGRFYGIMGPSGSGKSSLLYILSALKPPTGGTARFGDFVYGRHSLAELSQMRREKFGFVFQQPFLLPYLTALENIVLSAPQPAARAAGDRALTFLRDLGMSGLENKLPSQLSGGEKQRVSVVRAMMNDPQVIFADEPTAALDHANGHRVVDTLAQWRQRGGTVIVVTHDAEMLTGADQILLLRDGELVDGDP